MSGGGPKNWAFSSLLRPALALFLAIGALGMTSRMENSSKLSRCEPGAAQLHIWVVCLGAQAEGAFGELGALLYREARKKRAPCAEALAAAFGLSLSMMI